MNHYDVIVVGAGPAGNAAAYDLACAGARVALLEKQVLPRHKTCGGGMPMTVAQVLALGEMRDLAPEAFVEADTRYMRHTFRFENAHLAPINPDQPVPTSPKDAESLPETGASPLALWMVHRSVFDNALAQRAAKAGAELLDGLAVKTLTATPEGPLLVHAERRRNSDTGGECELRDWTATADTIIGADGANGIVARAFGLRHERSLAIAIEAEVPHRWGDGHPDLRPDVCHLEYGSVRNGYAWVFPKATHLNVGAGVFRPRREGERGDGSVRDELHKAILDYLRMLGVPQKAEELEFHAHPLPIWNGLDTLQTRDNRVLLAGDAAGLINPLFGDGILHALKSGKIAAKCILESRNIDYTRAIGAEFRANFDAALKISKIFYQFPGFIYKHGVTRPGATRQAVRLLSGDLQFNNVTSRILRVLRKAMLTDRTVNLQDIKEMEIQK